MAAPQVTHFNTNIFLNSIVNAVDLIDVFDPDGDEIMSYVVQDYQNDPTSGFFRLNGVAFENGSTFRIDADELENLVYVAGSRINWEGFRFFAIDENRDISSGADSGRLYTVRENITRPVVIADPISAIAEESLALEPLIRGFDPDGYPITQFFIRDSAVDNGFLEFNGEAIPQGEYRLIRADELQNLTYNTTGPASGEEIQAFAFDGELWSVWTRIDITTVPNVNIPVAQFARGFISSTQLEVETLPLAPLAVVTDDDGNTPKYFEFWNTSPHAVHGELVFRGAVQPRQQWIRVLPEELDQISFQAPDRDFIQQIRFRASDGLFRSAPGTISITTDFTFDDPPVVPMLETDGFLYDQQLVNYEVGDLFQRIDEGSPTISYQLYDGNPFGDRSARFELNNDPLDALTIHEFDRFTTDNFIRLRTGDFNNRERDDVLVRAQSEDGIWSAWSKLTARTEPEHFGAHFTGADWLGVAGIPRDGQGRLELSYSFMQVFPDYETGTAADDDFPENFSIFNQSQRESVRTAFDSFEAVANVKFIEVSDALPNVLGQRGGLFRFGNYGQDDDNAQAFTFLPSAAPESADVWFNRILLSEPRFTIDPQLPFGGSSYTTLLHELMHAMGFAHVFEGNVILPFETQTDDFSVLSTGPGQRADGLFPTTPQLYDVESLQTVYGVNPNFQSGDTVWSLATTWAGRDSFSESIYDAGGNDTLSLQGSDPLIGFGDDNSPFLHGNAIDLSPGGFSTFNGHLNNVSISLRANIENAIGSDIADSILGSHLDNTIDGRAGDDVLEGSIGNDLLTGGAGDDTFVFGVGDGRDVIDEQRLAGRDTLELVEFPTLNSLEEDFKFSLQGRDLVVDLNLDNSDVNDGSVRITNQVWGSYRIETLRLGGVDIDLVDLTQQVATGVDTFRVTEDSSRFGQLVVPV